MKISVTWNIFILNHKNSNLKCTDTVEGTLGLNIVSKHKNYVLWGLRQANKQTKATSTKPNLK